MRNENDTHMPPFGEAFFAQKNKDKIQFRPYIEREDWNTYLIFVPCRRG